MSGTNFVMLFVTVLGVSIWSLAGLQWWRKRKVRKQLKE